MTMIATERDRIEAEIVECCRYAKRQMRALGTLELPTKWDDAHGILDLLLTDWEASGFTSG